MQFSEEKTTTFTAQSRSLWLKVSAAGNDLSKASAVRPLWFLMMAQHHLPGGIALLASECANTSGLTKEGT